MAPDSHPAQPGSPLSADSSLATAPGDPGIPGRTRPPFEELPPGPPTWPGWLAIAAGVVALLFAFAVLGSALASGVTAGSVSAPDAVTAGIAALAGTVLLVGGLVWLAVAGILRRRGLGPDRYRGPSIIDLLLLVVIGGNLVALPIVLLLLRGDPGRLTDPLVVTVELLLTPAAFLIVYGFFIALPDALPGIGVGWGRAALRRLVLGVGVGLLAWLGLGVLVYLLNLIVTGITGSQLGGEQAVAGLATQVPLPTAVLAIAILAPVAEELFFRGAVLNAWEREYGTRRAIIGSASLFAIVHVAGGTPVAVVEVFILGLLLAWVYVQTRSLATTIGLHGAFNLASVLVLFMGLH